MNMSQLGLIKRIQHYLRAIKDSTLMAIHRNDVFRIEALEPRLLLSGTVEGRLWHDANENNLFDPDESALSDWIVYADLNRNDTLDSGEPNTLSLQDDPLTTEINEAGLYQLTDIPNSQTVIKVVSQTEWGMISPLPSTEAGNGKLTYHETLYDNLNGINRLENPRAVIASPDGNLLYVGSYDESSVTTFRINSTTGNLEFDDVFSTDYFRGINSFAISSNGHHLYTSIYTDNSIALLQRSAGNGGFRRITNYGSSSTQGTSHVTISNDGQFVYQTSNSSSSIAIYSRNSSGGYLSLIDTVQNNTNGLTDMAGTISFTLSPDGLFGYAASVGSNTITIFSRDPNTGLLTYSDTVHDNTGQITGLDGVISISISQDNQHLYAVSRDDHTLTVFERDLNTGQLTYLQHFTDGIGDTKYLKGANKVILAENQQFLYVSSFDDRSITTFLRSPQTGTLEFVQVQRHNVAGVEGLNGIVDFHISPNQQALYAVGSRSDAVTSFDISKAQGHPVLLHDNTLENINFTFIRHGDQYDFPSNNTPETAYPLGQITQGGLKDIDGYGLLYDQDWYSFQVTEPNVYGEFKAIRELGNGDFTFQLYDEQLNLIASANNNEIYELINTTLQPGQYFFHIFGDYEAQKYNIEWNIGLLPELSGTIWFDINQDGIRDQEEPSFQDVYIYLDLNGNNEYDNNEPEAITSIDDPNTPAIDEGGRYEFTDIPYGQYVIKVEISPQWVLPDKYLTAAAGDNTMGNQVTSPNGNLENGENMDISPDGRHIYVGDDRGEALILMERDTVTGVMTEIELYPPEHNPPEIEEVEEVVVSHDGRFVYVAWFSSRISLYNRNSETGQLTHKQTIHPTSDDDPLVNIINFTSIELSPDDQYLYVTSLDKNTITTISLSPETGEMSYLQHIANTSYLSHPKSIDISPDGRHVYVASLASGTITTLERDFETGHLSLVNAIRYGFTGYDMLKQVSYIRISDDGNNAYIASDINDSVGVLKRDPNTGTLTPLQFFKDGTILEGIDGPREISISSDGKLLAVAGEDESRVIIYSRNIHSGELTYLQRYSHSSSQNGIKLRDPIALEFSPDNLHLYVVSDYGVSVFERNANYGIPVNIAPNINAYLINIDMVSPDDRYDITSNDTLLEAYNISQFPNTPLSEIDGLAKLYDQDWYTLTINPGQTILDVFLDHEDGATINLKLYDQSANLVQNATSNSNTQLHLEAPVLAGNYYIQISGSYDGQTYDLHWLASTNPTVNGNLWHDINENGEMDEGEPGLGDWVIYADLNRNGRRDAQDVWTKTIADDPMTLDNETGQFILDVPVTETVPIVAELKSGWNYHFPAPDAAATYGNLTYDHAVVDNVNGIDGLRGLFDLRISPDSRFIYVANEGDGFITVLRHNEINDQLEVVQILSEEYPEFEDYGKAFEIEITSDGRELVAVGHTPDSSDHHAMFLLTIDQTTGKLIPKQQLVDEENGITGLKGVNQVIFADDGLTIHTSSSTEHNITTFKRTSRANNFVQTQDLDFSGHDPRGIRWINSLTISPDQRFVYGTDYGNDILFIFERNLTTGQLSIKERLTSQSGQTQYYDFMRDFKLSHDGKFGYLTNIILNSVTVFSRNIATGSLTVIQHLRPPNLDSPYSLTLSKDGQNVYVAGLDSDSVVTLSRDPSTGLLTYRQSFENGSGGISQMDGPFDIEISSDGNKVYALNLYSASIVTFDRTTNSNYIVDLNNANEFENLNYGLTFQDDLYDLIPNNSLNFATTLPVESHSQLSQLSGMGILKDNDWYQFTFTQGQSVLEFTLTDTHPQADTYLELYDEYGRLLHSSQNQSETQSIAIDHTGQFYIRVYGDFSGQTYNLTWSTSDLPTVSGRVFHDLNHDGIQNINEPGLAGIIVFADLNRNNHHDAHEPHTVTHFDDTLTTEVDESGEFNLSTLLGEQNIKVAAQLGWKTSYPDPSVIRGNGELTFVDIESTQQEIPLAGISNIAQSHDGIYLYTTNQQDNTLTVFKRNTTSGFTQLIQTVNTAAAQHLNAPSHITLSPDGLHAYVSSFEGDAIVVFSISPNTGQLTYSNTITQNDTDLTNLDGPRTSLISDDGAFLYLANFWSDSILVFARDENSGSLSLIDEYTNNIDEITGLDGIRDLKLSPDQNFLYAIGFSGDSVAVFARSSEFGVLEFVQSLHNNANGVTGLDGVSSITLSPDGLFAYTTGQNEDAITLFNRNPADGTLTFNKLYRNNILGVKNIDGVIDLIISPDGQDLYAAGSFSDAIVQFKRNPQNGHLAYHGSVVNNVGTAEGLDGVQSLIISNDEKHIYTGGFASGALAAWSRYYTTQVYEVDLSLGEVEAGLLFGSKQPADVSHDGIANADDIDLVYSVLPFGVYFASFDVNGDGELNQADIDSAVRDMHGTEYGDANLDRVVNLEDLAILATHFGQSNKGWAQGDYTGDKVVDLEDLALLAEYFGTDNRPAETSNGSGAAHNSNLDEYDLIEAAAKSISEDEAIWVSDSVGDDPHKHDDNHSHWNHIQKLLDENNETLI